LRQSSDKVRVHVIDDDPDTLQLIRAGIGTEMEVIESQDGISAVEIAMRYKPDLFIVDGVLPRMNGYQLTLMLRKNKEFYRTPIIFMSGKSATRDQQYAKKMGADQFLAKPFKVKELLELIRQIVTRAEFAIRADRMGMGQAHLEQLQHRETHRSEPLLDPDHLERRHLEKIIRQQNH
jgi:DNA-binding response OmpR family regulator